MSTWRKPTNDDLTGNLSTREVEVYNRSATFGGDDPSAQILSETADLVRGYCRSNGNIRLSPNAGEIPVSLISPAMDYAVFQLLKRMPVAIAEARRSAKDSALRIFWRRCRWQVLPRILRRGPGRKLWQGCRTTRGRLTAPRHLSNPRRPVTHHANPCPNHPG